MIYSKCLGTMDLGEKRRAGRLAATPEDMWGNRQRLMQLDGLCIGRKRGEQGKCSVHHRSPGNMHLQKIFERPPKSLAGLIGNILPLYETTP